MEFGEGYYRSPLETTYQSYLDTREEIFKGREDKFVCLMDLALMAMRKLKKTANWMTWKNPMRSMPAP